MLQGDTFAPYVYIICVDYVLRTSIDTMKENGFKLVKERRYPTQTITDMNYADYISYRLAIDGLSVIWRLELIDKTEHIFLSSGRVDTAIWMHYIDTS